MGSLKQPYLTSSKTINKITVNTIVYSVLLLFFNELFIIIFIHNIYFIIEVLASIYCTGNEGVKVQLLLTITLIAAEIRRHAQLAQT